jgi:hypothetical protein
VEVLKQYEFTEDLTAYGSGVGVSQLYYNNVGEPESHPSLPLVNSLQPYFSYAQGKFYSVWDRHEFYGVGAIKDKWETDRFEISPEQRGAGSELICCALG